MQRENTPRGFTLIELLVVVLIIGILAAVALPQYQKAVDKSHMVQGTNLLNSLHKAQEMHYLATGAYTIDFSELDMDFGSTGCEIFGDLNRQLFCKSHGIYLANGQNSPGSSYNPGGAHIAFCPGETINENCRQDDNQVVWYFEHHPLPYYQNRVICTQATTPRSQPLCELVKQLANK